MRDLVILLVHVITTIVKFVRPGGLRAVVAESVLAKHQLLILNRSRQRAPNLLALDRLIAGICSLWIRPNRLRRLAIAFKPSTLLSFHRALVKRMVSPTFRFSGVASVRRKMLSEFASMSHVITLPLASFDWTEKWTCGFCQATSRSLPSTSMTLLLSY